MTNHTELRDRIRRAVYERLAHGPSAPDVLDPIADAALHAIDPLLRELDEARAELERLQEGLRHEREIADKLKAAATEEATGWELQATPNMPSHRPPSADMEAGAVYDIGGAFAIYWPDTHPCRERRDQWVVLTQDGGVEVTHDRPRDRMVRIGRVDRAPDRQVRSLAWLLWTASRWQWSREGCATEAARWLHDLTPTSKPTQSQEATDA